MVKQKNTEKRQFISRNHTILTAYRHKQIMATLVSTNRIDFKTLVAANVIIYKRGNKARLTYKNGHQGLPCLERNLVNFYYEKTSTEL